MRSQAESVLGLHPVDARRAGRICLWAHIYRTEEHSVRSAPCGELGWVSNPDRQSAANEQRRQRVAQQNVRASILRISILGGASHFLFVPSRSESA